MKVLFITHRVLVGGVETLLRDITGVLLSDGCEVTVLVPFGENIKDSCFFDSRVKVMSLFNREPRKKWLRTAWGRADFLPVWFWRGFHPFHRYDKVVSFMPDMLHLALASGIPRNVIWWNHGTMASVERGKALKSRLHGWRQRRLLRCLKGGNRIFVSSSGMETCEAFYGVPGGRILNNPLDVDRILRLSGEPQDVMRPKTGVANLISVGRLWTDKHFDRLLDVVVKLRDGGHPFHLWIVGDGSERGVLEAFATDNGLADFVTFLGEQANPFNLMKCADVYVCPSMTEGFGLSMAEALVLGVPVVSGDNGGGRDIVTESGYGIITENTIDGMYDGVVEMLRRGCPRVPTAYAARQRAWREEYMADIRKMLEGDARSGERVLDFSL